MDDQTLAAQLEKTGDIMDLARDEAWVRESARIEAECGGRIEAGLAVKAYAQAKYDDSLGHVRQELRSQMRVQSILFGELRRWMETWDIGGAFSDTYTEARELIRAHLKQPTPELEAWAAAVLEEDTQAQENADKPVRAKTRAQLLLMMSDEDWETLARVAAAAIADIVLAHAPQASKVEQEATVAA
ncbi:MAG: hypothetical protein AAFO83_07285 [Cyanobacteria bacterium J06607_13]